MKEVFPNINNYNNRNDASGQPTHIIIKISDYQNNGIKYQNKKLFKYTWKKVFNREFPRNRNVILSIDDILQHLTPQHESIIVLCFRHLPKGNNFWKTNVECERDIILPLNHRSFWISKIAASDDSRGITNHEDKSNYNLASVLSNWQPDFNLKLH